jgi:hypothetical protein
VEILYKTTIDYGNTLSGPNKIVAGMGRVPYETCKEDEPQSSSVLWCRHLG